MFVLRLPALILWTLKCTITKTSTFNICLQVTAGSLAEQAGLKVGDMLLQANGQPLSFLTHYEYSKFLQEAGNFIELSIIR
jgi:Periplasmic protease